MILTLVSMTFVTMSVFAGLRTNGQVSTVTQDASFLVTVKEGYHFNEKAPNSAVIDGQMTKASKVGAREVVFSSLPKEMKTGLATVYICDDAVTFCETSVFDMKTGAEILPTLAASSPAPKKKREKSLRSHCKRESLTNMVFLKTSSRMLCPRQRPQISWCLSIFRRDGVRAACD